MIRGFGSSASGQSCICKPKDKRRWEVIGYTGKNKDGYIIYCNQCHCQWDTKANYAKELPLSINLRARKNKGDV